MRMKVKIPLIAEIEARSRAEAERKLDAFREATLPSENYGVLLYQPRDEQPSYPLTCPQCGNKEFKEIGMIYAENRVKPYTTERGAPVQVDVGGFDWGDLFVVAGVACAKCHAAVWKREDPIVVPVEHLLM